MARREGWEGRLRFARMAGRGIYGLRREESGTSQPQAWLLLFSSDFAPVRRRRPYSVLCASSQSRETSFEPPQPRRSPSRRQLAPTSSAFFLVGFELQEAQGRLLNLNPRLTTTRMAQSRPAADTLSFNPVRELLNPKFETYHLQVPSDPNTTSLHPLPAPGIKLRALPEHARLSFSEVQARVRHNHLSVGMAGECVYVDGDLGVVAITLDEVSGVMFRGT